MKINLNKILIKRADSHEQMLILIDIIHGHAILRKKRRHIRHLPATVRPRIFAPHFFTIEDASLLEKSRDEDKVAAAEQGNFHWERSLSLFSITKLLVSLVHQFIWPSFTLVFTRNGVNIQPKALNEVDVQASKAVV